MREVSRGEDARQRRATELVDLDRSDGSICRPSWIGERCAMTQGGRRHEDAGDGVLSGCRGDAHAVGIRGDRGHGLRADPRARLFERPGLPAVKAASTGKTVMSETIRPRSADQVLGAGSGSEDADGPARVLVAVAD